MKIIIECEEQELFLSQPRNDLFLRDVLKIEHATEVEEEKSSALINELKALSHEHGCTPAAFLAACSSGVVSKQISAQLFFVGSDGVPDRPDKIRTNIAKISSQPARLT